MNNVYQEILSRVVEEDFAKADLNDEPRAEMRAKFPDKDLGKGESVVDRTKRPDPDNPLECSLDMSDDAHHSGDELEGEHVDPIGSGMSSQGMVNHPRSGGASDGMGNKGGDMHKGARTTAGTGPTGGKSNSSMSETSASGLGGADHLASGHFSVPAENWQTHSGLDHVDSGQNVELSDDDTSIEGELAEGHRRPIESTVPHGSADLGQNKHMGWEGGGDAKGGSSMSMVSHQRPVSKGFGDRNGVQEKEAAIRQLTKAQEIQISFDKAESARVAEAAPNGQTWRVGMVNYSTGTDEAIAKAMKDSGGHVLGEPTLGTNSNMSKARSCGLCKSLVPRFLTVCPCCGR